MLTNFLYNKSLLKCIIMDLIGWLSYAVLGLGEYTDIVWAPISAYVFYQTFGGTRGMIGGILNFIEEISPGLDFIPSFTIMWFMQKNKENKMQTNTKNVTEDIAHEVIK